MIPEFSVELGNREQGTGNREEGFQYVPSSVQKSNRSPIIEKHFANIGDFQLPEIVRK
ncbi:MAG: hypothetical protein HEQ13_12310 [Dolichospermum sp. DEX189]|nr:hypothetical protein [Dolichospermum sp. DEX189]